MTTTPLADDVFRKVAGDKATRLTAEQVATALDAPSGTRPRLLALWHGQLVSVPSLHYFDRYRDDAEAWWVSGATLADLVRRA